MKGLSVIAITFTNRCNLACVHCGRNQEMSGQQEKDANFFINVLKEGRDLGAGQVNITGGEIFCRKDCLDLIDGAVQLGYFVSIESNGTLINQQSIDALIPYGSNIRVSISVDGLTSDVHDAIRGDGTFKVTMDTIGRLKKAGIPTRIITVLHRHNINQIPAIAKLFVDEMGLGFRLLPNIMEYGKGVYACDAYGVKLEEAMALLQNFYFDFLRKKATENVTLGLNIALSPMDTKHFHLCPWGKAMIGIGPTGIASLCHVSYHDPRFIFGNLEDCSLMDIWTKNSVLDKFRNLDVNKLQGICGNCLAREVCRGGCRLHAITRYGDFFSPDPYCQTAYNLGKFPEYAMEEDNKNCSFAKE